MKNMTTTRIQIQIPNDLDFSALKLSRDPVTLDVSIDRRPLEIICELSKIDIAILEMDDNIAEILNAWYRAHLLRGGAPDPVQEQLWAEVQAEAAAGGQAGVINHGGLLQ